VSHARLTAGVRERAALYALGALEPTEAATFAAHLNEGCTTCEQEVRRLASVASGLGYTSPVAAPEPDLRSRLLARLPARADGAITVAAADGAAWEPSPAPGVTFRRLARNDETRVLTLVVRIAPGGAYPTHRHAGLEETFMLDGDLVVSGERLGPGDYCAAADGSVHAGIRTQGGCSFLALHSERNEYPGEIASTHAGLTFVREADAPWKHAGSDDVDVRLLHREPDGRVTLHVRMEPGARIAPHRHLAAEQCYMLAGERRVGTRVYHAGDYWHAAPGSLHEASESPGGCAYLLIASRPETGG
jgi:anti-sigma factor ChrR (cupin superfamily)